MSRSELEKSPLFSVALIYSAVSAFGFIVVTSAATLMSAISSSFGSQPSAKEALAITICLFIALCGFVGVHGFAKCLGWGRKLLILFHVAATSFAVYGLIGEKLSGGIAVSFLTSTLLATGVIFFLTRPDVRKVMEVVEMGPSRDVLGNQGPYIPMKEL